MESANSVLLAALLHTFCSSLLLTVLTIQQGYKGYYKLFRVIWHTKPMKKGDLPRPPMTVMTGLEGFLYVMKAASGSSKQYIYQDICQRLAEADFTT